MQQKNLVLQWIRQSTPATCRSIGDRIRSQIAQAQAAEYEADGPSLARLVATVLFVECADDLDLSPLELHGLLEEPRRQCMEAVALLALDWISRTPDPRPVHGSIRSTQWDCPPVS
jgi:hypothetical protein